MKILNALTHLPNLILCKKAHTHSGKTLSIIIDNAKVPLASKINDCVGDTDLCKMWQDHYQFLLNSVKSIEHRTSDTNTLSSIVNKSIELKPFDIGNALKSVNKGKACGIKSLAAEHFILLMNVFMLFYLFYLIV